MTLFLFISLIICVAVALCLIFGVRAATRQSFTTRLTATDELLSVFKDRRKELESDRDAGRISVPEYTSSLSELYIQLEREAPELVNSASGNTGSTNVQHQEVKNSRSKPSVWVLAAIATALLISIGSYLVTGAPELTDQFYRAELVQAQNQMKAGSSGSLKPTTDIATEISEVKKLIEATPKDASLWGSLAKLERMSGEPAKAVISFTKAGELGLKSPEYLVDFAEAIAASKNGDFSGEPIAMLGQALKIAPDLPKAVALMGAAQLRLGNNEKAAVYLKRTIEFLEPGSPQAQAVQAALDRISAAPTKETSTPFAIRGTATIDSALSSKLNALDPARAAIFIAARAVDRPMPIAALRLPLSALKNGSIAFELTQVNQLSTTQLKDQTELIIVARISANGTATKAAGDLVGSTSPLPSKTLFDTTSKAAVSVLINQLVSAGE